MIELSPTAADAMLDVLSQLMDGGNIELMADNGRVLAVLQLSSPAAMPAVDGVLDFQYIIGEDAALGTGDITTARIFGPTGDQIFSCDVGDDASDAVIKLIGTTKIYRGQKIGLDSFRLAMP